MKLLSLNTWGGQRFEELLAYIRSQSSSTDIFFFQEVFSTPTKKTETRGARANLYSELETALTDFTGHYARAESGLDYLGIVDFPLDFGLAAFTRKGLDVHDTGSITIYQGSNDHVHGNRPRILQYLRLHYNKDAYTLCNIHGLWDPQGKQDSIDRLDQALRIRHFLSGENGTSIVLAGDFNLLPDSHCLALIQDNLRNLIKDHSITSTRSDLYTKPGKYADYAFVSPEVHVKNFDVPHVLVSDHLPLILEFE